MGLSPIAEPCQESRRIDYATAVFYSATPSHQRDLFEFAIDVGEQLADFPFREKGQSPHFDRVFSNDLGVRIEITPVGASNSRNPGLTALTLPGAAFYCSTPQNHTTQLWRICHRNGFRWFSRLDLQNTELEPAWDTERVYEAVEARELWVKGYGRYRPWRETDAAGNCADGMTLYWGSSRSEKQGRSYDKAKQSGWKTPAIRDEIQLRGDWAHATGQALAGALDSAFGSDQMAEAVEQLVTGSLNQHLQYWTLKGTDPKTDKNWQRKAEPADWFLDRIGRQQTAIKKVPKPALDLSSSVAWGARQYGRYFALDVLLKQKRSQLPLEQVVEGLWEKFLARLTPEDLEAVYGAEGPEVVAEMQELVLELQRKVAFEGEHAELNG